MHAKRVVLEQMRVAIALADATLAGIDDDELHWRPAADSWDAHVRDGVVEADWVEPEPDDVAPPTLAWQLWHVQWWIEMALDSWFGDGSLSRDSFKLSADDLSLAAFQQRHRLLRDSLDAVPEERWESEKGTGFPYHDGRPLGLLAGWASLELTKCVAEMVRTRAFARAGPTAS